ncbi:MAG: hypothetical protein ABIO02_00850 [Patescibacteria group bacterium]
MSLLENGIDHHLGQQREANSVVPFPKDKILKGGTGLLEYYLANLQKSDRLFSYSSLPDSLSAGSSDSYLSWLADLTKKDPNHRERAAFTHLDLSKDTLVYPVNPSIGIYQRSVAEVGMGKRFFPLQRNHSHPETSCFSPQDLKRVIGDPEFISEGLGTQDKNYLLLRTDETILDDWAVAEEKMESIKEDLQESFDAYRNIFDSLIEHGATQDVINVYKALNYEEDIKEFGTNAMIYYLTHNMTYIVAEKFKLGFYYSDKDGIFRRFTADKLVDIQERMIKAGNNVFDRLAQITETLG